MFLLKPILALPGVFGLLAFAGLSFTAHAPVVQARAVVPLSDAARAAVPAASAQDDDAAPPLQRRFRRSRDGLFYVTARVNGVAVRFLLDTGATMVVLTPADATRVGAAFGGPARHTMMETAAGPSAIDRITLDHVAIAGHRITDVDAAVVRRGLKVSLLGQDLLSQLGPVTISGNALELN